MPSISIRSYSDPEHYQTAFVGAQVELLPTQPGPFTARAIRIAFDDLWIARAQESAPRVLHATMVPTRAFITFPTCHQSEVITDGMAVPAAGFMRHSPAHSFHERTTGPSGWGVMSLPVEGMAAAGVSITGRALLPPDRTMRVSSRPIEMARLLRLHAAAGTLAGTAPEVMAHAEVARGLEQSLIEAMVRCQADAEARDEKFAQRCHETTMRRFRRVLDENPERALYLPEICAAINVPDRTLRLCCQEHLGMGPKQYLLLRRLHLARRALRAADPGVATVTEIATQFGFWHFGRFAGMYNSMFGESPSMTLKRQPQ